MPLYEYHCPQCNYDFSAFRRYDEGHVKYCPDCGAQVRRAYSDFTFRFAGCGGSFSSDVKTEEKSKDDY